MKDQLMLAFVTFFAIPLFAQTEWAAEGNRWWYNTRDFGAYNMTSEYESTGQAVVGGQLCQVIQRGSFSYYTYESNGQVYLWENEDSVFSLRYDWSKTQGETYDCSTAGQSGQELTCHVDTVYSIDLGGQTFQVQDITMTTPSLPCCDMHETVIVGIGGTSLFDARFVTDLTVDIVFDLLCFESGSTGLLTITEVPFANCFNLANPVFEVNGQVFEMSVSPNPAPGRAVLRYALPPNIHAVAYFSDGLGRTHAIFPLENAQGETHLENLPAGLHFVTLKVEGQVVGTQKLVVH